MSYKGLKMNNLQLKKRLKYWTFLKSTRNFSLKKNAARFTGCGLQGGRLRGCGLYIYTHHTPQKN